MDLSDIEKHADGSPIFLAFLLDSDLFWGHFQLELSLIFASRKSSNPLSRKDPVVSGKRKLNLSIGETMLG